MAESLDLADVQIDVTEVHEVGIAGVSAWAVVCRHLPTGLAVSATDASQHRAKEHAMEQLESLVRTALGESDHAE